MHLHGSVRGCLSTFLALKLSHRSSRLLRSDNLDMVGLMLRERFEARIQSAIRNSLLSPAVIQSGASCRGCAVVAQTGLDIREARQAGAGGVGQLHRLAVRVTIISCTAALD